MSSDDGDFTDPATRASWTRGNATPAANLAPQPLLARLERMA